MSKLIKNALSAEIHASNVAAGWWNDNRPDGTSIALIHSEISEAFNGYLLSIEDHHLPQYPNLAVELADAAIRIYDLAGRKEWDLERAMQYVRETESFEFVPDLIDAGRNHNNLQMEEASRFIATAQLRVSNALEGIRKNEFIFLEAGEPISIAAYEMAILLNMIYRTDTWGFDIPTIMDAKREYNARRADHKLENRAKENGKKF